MKNVLKIIALSGLIVSASFAADKAAASSWVDGLSLKGSVGFESEYLYRGHQIASDVIVTSIEGAYKLSNGSLYAGVLNNDSAKTSFSESDFYVGYKMPVYEKFSADFGYTYYWYTQPSTVDRRNEIYAGVTYNGLWVNPAVYVYYDINENAWTGELSGKYSIDLAKYGVAKTALDLGAYIGGVTATDATAGQLASSVHSGYGYYGVTADAVYSFAKNAAGSVGIRYGGNSNNGASFVDSTNDVRNSFYWGAKFTAGF